MQNDKRWHNSEEDKILDTPSGHDYNQIDLGDIHVYGSVIYQAY